MAICFLGNKIQYSTLKVKKKICHYLIISYTLFIYPYELLFEKLINDFACGGCLNFIKKKRQFFVNSEELYYCRIMEKKIKVYDEETVKSVLLHGFKREKIIIKQTLIFLKNKKVFTELHLSA